jgi:hypothetical protein
MHTHILPCRCDISNSKIPNADVILFFVTTGVGLRDVVRCKVSISRTNGFIIEYFILFLRKIHHRIGQ